MRRGSLPRQAIPSAQFIATDRVALGDVTVGLGDVVTDARLRLPEQRVLDDVPLVGRDHDRCRRSVLRQGDVLMRALRLVDELVEPRLRGADRQGSHGGIVRQVRFESGLY